MIKYLGSKRRLVPVLGDLCSAVGAARALDLFTGTTRVAQEFKRRGANTTAVDSARYAFEFARAYVALDGGHADRRELAAALADLQARPDRDGYVTETFCRKSRFFRPHNGRRIDAIRDAIEHDYRDSWMYPVLLTSLIEGADRVDSTTGVQMAYVKQWADRAHKDLELRLPDLVAGPGTAVFGDACALVEELGEFDVAYLDPPYNQHRYFTNYHIWETLVAWDAPVHYGVACKRVDARDTSTKSVFNDRRRMPCALNHVIGSVDARLVVVSYNDEAWVSIDDLRAMASARGGAVHVLAFDSKRYVGAQIGIHNPRGEKVGQVSRLRNVEYLVLAGEPELVARAVDAAERSGRHPGGVPRITTTW
ncbi:MAG: DNA adenine methylase [Acidimicrobiia bacterium]